VELILISQSACDISHIPGGRLLPGLWLPSQSKDITDLRLVPNSIAYMTDWIGLSKV